MFNSHTLRATLAGLCGLLACPLLPAEAAELATQMDEVVVTSGRIEERLSAELADYGHQVTVLTKEQLVRGGYTDLSQALDNLAPGLFLSLKNGRGDYSTQFLHGSSNILWLVDGVRINNRLYGQGYLDTLALFQIERIEILYGGEGLFYGTEATAGVVNIITVPPELPSDKTASGELGAGYGSFQARQAHGLVTAGSGRHRVQAFASQDAWDGFQPFTDAVYARMANPAPEDREYSRNNVGLKYQAQLDEAGDAVFNLHIQRNSGDFDYAYPDEHNAVNERSEDLIIAKLDQDLTQNFSYYIKSFVHRWWTDYTRQTLDGSYLYEDALWGYQDWGVNLLSSYHFLGDQELLAGLDYQNYYGKDEVTDIYTESEEVGALFLQYRPVFSWAPQLKSALGLRYNQTGDTDATIWNLSARHPLGAGMALRMNVGTSFILPTAEQLWTNDQDSGVYGNPDLKPQESFNIDLGLEGRLALLSYGLGYFQQVVTDRIVFATETYENVDEETTVHGFELLAGVGPWHGMQVNASFTFTDASQDGTSGQADAIPEYYGKLNLGWQHPLQDMLLAVDLSTRYVGPVSKYDTDYGCYWLTDASSSLSFGEDQRHRLTLRLENIFDEAYASRLYRGTDAQEQSYIYEGRGTPFNAMLSYSYRFSL